MPFERVLLSGYYGFANAGDEAVLSSIIGGLRSYIDRDLSISVLSGNPVETETSHKVHALSREIRGLGRAVGDCDLLISGGGSLIQDATSLRSLIYYLGVIRLAKLKRRKVMVLGQGIGPLRRGISRFLCRQVLNAVDLITVRDADSQSLLREIGVRKPPIHVTADPACILEPCSDEETKNLLEQCGINGVDDFVVVSLRNWVESPEIEQTALEALKRLAEHLPVKILLLGMQVPDDLELSRRMHAVVGKTHLQSGAWTPKQIRGVIGKSRLVIGMRLHALILAASACVPCVGISYDPKVKSFQQSVGQDCLELKSLTADMLVDRVVKAWDARETSAAELAEIVPGLKEAAVENFTLAARLLAYTSK